ncbi:uncharacterized protein LOC135352302 isoform X2 [Halichondria panicea]
MEWKKTKVPDTIVSELDPVVIISFTSSETVHDCLGPSIAVAPTEEALELPRQGATAALSLAAASLWVNLAAKKAIGSEAYEKCRGKDEHDTPISPGLYLAGLNCSQLHNITGYFNRYAMWKVKCQEANKSLGSVCVVTGAETKMKITKVAVGPFVNILEL